MVDLMESLAFVLVALLFGVGECQRIRPEESGRAPEDSKCWYPNYYCSFTPENIVGSSSFGVDVENAKACYDLCNAEGDCNHFTWIKMRGVAKCYLLDNCANNLNEGPNYRIYDDHCLNRATRMCISGPDDCSAKENMTSCLPPSSVPDQSLIEWQCEDNTLGNFVNLYDLAAELVPGTRCLQTCDSWQAKRTTSEAIPRAYIFSECQFDGAWGPVTPYDRYDDGEPTELHFPPAPDGGYPLPDNPDALSCQCDDLVLKYPVGSGGTAYNPRSEPGADLECNEEIENEAIDAAGEVKIQSYNICRFFCDNYLVATISCQDGAWKGGIDVGFWCYLEPNDAARECGRMDWRCGRGLPNAPAPPTASAPASAPAPAPAPSPPSAPVSTLQTPTSIVMSSTYNDEGEYHEAGNCIDGVIEGGTPCGTDWEEGVSYPFIALEMPCRFIPTQIKMYGGHGLLCSRHNITDFNIRVLDAMPAEGKATELNADGTEIFTGGPYCYDGSNPIVPYVADISSPVAGSVVFIELEGHESLWGSAKVLQFREIQVFGYCE